MKIALIHFRVYETDGVSLEMDKWRHSLEQMGHEVVYLSGTNPKNNDLYLKELYYQAKYNEVIHRNAFIKLTDFSSSKELLTEINYYANLIYQKLKTLIIENSLDVIVPNNVSSLGYNLPVGIAIGKIAQEKLVKIIYHHHDFYWERIRYQTPLFPEINKLLKTFFPYPANAVHCVINQLAKEALQNKINKEVNVVPNVFAFSQPLWEIDDYNRELRRNYGIKDNDLVFLQATRIVERKAIELGYQVVKEVSKQIEYYQGKELYNGQLLTKNTKIHFVLAGLNELSPTKFAILDRLLQDSNVKIHYLNDVVSHGRKSVDNKKIFSLWDLYTMCDFITYPSILEGWGNQLLEGVFAKKPLLVYQYPVYKSDIKQFGFNFVEIDSKLIQNKETFLFEVAEETTKRKAKEIIELLTNKTEYYQTTKTNFMIGKEYLSYNSLNHILKKVLKQL